MAVFLLDQEEAWGLYKGADKGPKTDLANIVKPLHLQLVVPWFELYRLYIAVTPHVYQSLLSARGKFFFKDDENSE